MLHNSSQIMQLTGESHRAGGGRALSPCHLSLNGWLTSSLLVITVRGGGGVVVVIVVSLF